MTEENEEKLVSILIPTYNTSLYLGRALISAFGQSYKSIEVIVVDDDSTDGTRELLLAASHLDHRLRIYFQEEHRGAGETRNKCLKEARGEYLFWLDSDDYIAHDCIEILLSLIQNEHSSAARIDFSHDGKGLVTMDTPAYLSHVLTDRYKSYLAGTLFERRAFEDVNFPEKSVVEDYYVYPEIAAQIGKITIVHSKELYFYTENRSGSLTNTYQKELRGQHDRMIAAFKRYDDFSDAYADECAIVLEQAVSYALMTWYLAKKEKNKTAMHDAHQLLLEHKEHIDKVVAGRKHKEVHGILDHPITAQIFYCLHMLKRKIAGSR